MEFEVRSILLGEVQMRVMVSESSMICPCGNSTEYEGFYACDVNGFSCEPLRGLWDGLYKCSCCEKILNVDTLEVVS